MINDQEAASLAGSYDSITDPAKRQQVLGLLRDYREASRVKEQQAASEHIDRIYSDLDTMGGTWTKSEQDTYAPFVPDVQKFKARQANRYFLASQAGLSMEDAGKNLDTLRDKFAFDKYGLRKVDDVQFYGLVQGDVMKRREAEDAARNLATNAVQSAIGSVVQFKPREWGAAWSEFAASAGLDPADTQSAGAYRQLYNRFSDTARRNFPVFNALKAALEVQTSAETGLVKDPALLIDAGRMLARLPDDEQQAVFQALGMVSRPDAAKKEGVTANEMGETMGRTMTGMGQGFALMGHLSDVNRAIERLRAGAPVYVGAEPAWKDALSGFMEEYPEAGRQTATEEQRRQMLNQALEEREAVQTINRLQQFAEQGFDPIESMPGWRGTIERGIYGIGSTAVTMAMTAAPGVGMLALGGGLTGQEYRRITAEFPEMSHSSAVQVAALSGFGQAGLEKLQLKSLGLRLPQTTGFLGELTRPSTRFLRRFGVNFGAQTALQNVQEGVQDIIPAVAQELFSRIKDDVPAVDWDKAREEWLGSRAETAIALLPFTLIGAGVSSLADVRGAEAGLRDPETLERLGITPEWIDRLTNIDDTPALETAFRDAWKSRTKESLAQAKNLNEIQPKLDEALQNDPDSPTIDRTATGEYRVIRPDGSVLLQTTDEETAYNAWKDSALSQFEDTQEILGELIASVQGKVPGLKGVSRTKKRQSGLTESEERVSTGEARVDVIGQMERSMQIAGLTGGLDAIQILGSNRLELANNAYEFNVKLHEGANVFTLFEEVAEGYVKKAMAEKTISPEILESKLREAEGMVGRQILADGPVDEMALIEGFSKTAVAYAAQRVRDSDLPQGLRGAMRYLAEFYKGTMTLAARIKKARKKGALDPEFERALAESVGLGEAQTYQQGLQQAETEISGQPAEAATYAIAPATYLKTIQSRIDITKKNPKERIRILEQAKKMVTALDRSQQFVLGVEKKRGGDVDRVKMLQAFGTLDVIASVFPPEVRTAIGGASFEKLAKLKTSAARTKYIESQIKKLDERLETFLRKDYQEQIRAALKKSRPKEGDSKVRKSVLGSEAQAWADKAFAASLLDEDTTARRLAEIEAKLDAATDPDQIEHLVEDWAILLAFGDFMNPDRPAAELATALKELENIIKDGRSSWRIQEQDRRDRMAQMRGLVIGTLGAATRGGIAAATGQRNILQKADEVATQHYSAIQLIADLLGHDHPVTRHFAKEIRRANNRKESLMISAVNRFREAIGPVLGIQGKSRIRQRTVIDRALWRTSQRKQSVSVLTGRKVKRERVSIELAEKMVRGEVDHGLTMKDLARLRSELHQLPGDSRKEYVSYERVVSEGRPEDVQISPLEASYWLLSWAQPDARAKMERQGFTEESIQGMKEITSDPFMQALIEFVRKEYREEWGPMNQVYRRLFGMNMPSLDNYAPLSFEHGKGAPEEMTPFGPVFSQGGMATGFLKSRTEHNAMLKQENMLSIFWRHKAQATHWQTHAELIREMRSIFNSADVALSIKQAHGEEKLRQLHSWIETLATGGGRKADGLQIWEKLGQRMLRGQAAAALGFRVKTIAQQLDSGLRFMLRVPVRAQLRGIADLVTGQLWARVSDVWKSDSIQRRLESGYSPEVRLLLNPIGAKPSVLLRLAEAGTLPMQYADAALTAVSGAIVFDYHYRLALKSGMNETAATAAASDAMDQAIFETSQPASVGNRSLLEVNGGVMHKLFFQFRSDARLKVALEYEAWKGIATGKIPIAEGLRTIFVLHGFALLGQLMADLIKDGFTAEDDEDIWKPQNYLRAYALGHLNGVFLLGDAAEIATARIFGTKAYQQSENVAANAANAFAGLKEHPEKLFDWEDPEKAADQWRKATRALAVLGGAYAAPAVVANAFRDAVGAIENVDESDE